MLVGVHPFDPRGDASNEEIEKRIKQQNRRELSKLTSHLTPSARDFIKSLIDPDPSKRLTAITALRVSDSG